MNLADAIRQAATAVGPTNCVTPTKPSAPVLAAQKEVEIVNITTNSAQDTPVPSNVVRLELVLNPEQFSSLLRAIVAGQHSVMTLREAAAYLRMPGNVVDQMATEGKLPALSIDGKWRFTHAALDEWINSRQAEDLTFDKAVGA